ncbi:MAG: C4-dicarboxylate transporter DcuC, partial [Firmicutes bacterium]|nr:C4-dicarboxylate transporter DcuC [Bacillota bacterium]
MLWLGAAITVLVFVGIILKFDTKLCLILGGALMCLLGGQLSAAVPAYCASVVNGTIVYYTCISLGYSTVMKTMGCTDHIIYALLGPLSKVKKGLVPLTTIITWFFMQALSSAATCAAVEGSIMIPIMTALGIPAATSAAAILVGTGCGPSLNPGGTFYVASAEADPLGEASGVGMVSAGFVPGCIAVVFAGIGVMIMGKILDKGDTQGSEEAARKAMETAASFKVNPLYAIMPLIPLMLILIANYTPLLDQKVFDVPTCMFCGFALSLLVFMKDYKTVSTAFFRGQGDAFFSIITL